MISWPSERLSACQGVLSSCMDLHSSLSKTRWADCSYSCAQNSSVALYVGIKLGHRNSGSRFPLDEFSRGVATASLAYGRDSLGVHPPTFPWTTKASRPFPSLQMAGTQLGPVGGRKGSSRGHIINIKSFIRVVDRGLVLLYPGNVNCVEVCYTLVSLESECHNEISVFCLDCWIACRFVFRRVTCSDFGTETTY